MCYTRSSAGLYIQNTIPTEITPEAVREGREREVKTAAICTTM